MIRKRLAKPWAAALALSLLATPAAACWMSVDQLKAANLEIVGPYLEEMTMKDFENIRRKDPDLGVSKLIALAYAQERTLIGAFGPLLECWSVLWERHKRASRKPGQMDLLLRGAATGLLRGEVERLVGRTFDHERSRLVGVVFEGVWRPRYLRLFDADLKEKSGAKAHLEDEDYGRWTFTRDGRAIHTPPPGEKKQDFRWRYLGGDGKIRFQGGENQDFTLNIKSFDRNRVTLKIGDDVAGLEIGFERAP